MLEVYQKKEVVAGVPQNITHCNCGYLMRTTPIYSYKQRARAPVLHVEVRLFSELFFQILKASFSEVYTVSIPRHCYRLRT